MTQNEQSSGRTKSIGLIAGPVVAVCLYFLLPGTDDVLPPAARAAAAVGSLMAVWWMTEAVPLAITSLLPIVLYPLLGVFNVPFQPGESVKYKDGDAIFVASKDDSQCEITFESNGESTSRVVAEKELKPKRTPIERTVAPYAHRFIYLFLGGFIIALAIENTGLHRRIALNTLNWVGPNPRSLIAGFMGATGFLSMWISNTASTVMMVPIALSLTELLRTQRDPETGATIDEEQANSFACCLLLCVAYSASVGGIGSLVGTPTNLFLASFLSSKDISLDFAQWMIFALPFSLTFLVIIWFVMTRFINRFEIATIPGGRALIRNELKSIGRMSVDEKKVAAVFILTATCWILRGLLSRFDVVKQTVPLITRVDDTIIAMTSAILLFIIPATSETNGGKRILSWDDSKRLPWGILILFGGGLALAEGVVGSGLASYIAKAVSSLEGASIVLLVLVTTGVVVFMTELTSNTPTATLFMPLLFQVAGAISTSSGAIDPMLLLVPTTMAASCAFMLPVATPPNAIVFGSGQISIRQMARAGIWLNLIAVFLIPLFVMTWGKIVLLQN